MAWTTIPDSDVDAESPLTESLAKRWRDNPEAVAAGDASVPYAKKVLVPQALRTNSNDTALALCPDGSGGMQLQPISSFIGPPQATLFVSGESRTIDSGLWKMSYRGGTRRYYVVGGGATFYDTWLDEELTGDALFSGGSFLGHTTRRRYMVFNQYQDTSAPSHGPLTNNATGEDSPTPPFSLSGLTISLFGMSPWVGGSAYELQAVLHRIK